MSHGCRAAIAAGACSIAANILAYPCTDGIGAMSPRRCRSPFLGADEGEFFPKPYAPDPSMCEVTELTPSHATRSDELSSTMALEVEQDVTMEQAEDYGNGIGMAGVQVKTHRYSMMIHGFIVFDPLPAGAAGTALRDVATFLRGVAAGDGGRSIRAAMNMVDMMSPIIIVRDVPGCRPAGDDGGSPHDRRARHVARQTRKR